MTYRAPAFFCPVADSDRTTACFALMHPFGQKRLLQDAAMISTQCTSSLFTYERPVQRSLDASWLVIRDHDPLRIVA
jgi:hypothetical protein